MDDDRINMEDIKHQDEDENVTTIENNLNKKTKEEKIKKNVDKGYGSSWTFSEKLL